MDVKIFPNNLSGQYLAPSNKQSAIVAFSLAGFSASTTYINARALPSFACSVIDCLRALGVPVRELDGTYMVSPIQKSEDTININVQNNPSALRFILPIACACYNSIEFEGDDALRKHNFADALYALKGVGFTAESLPFIVRGSLEAGEYYLKGSEGANFISGLIIALALKESDSKIIFTGKVQGKAGIDACVSMLKTFSIDIEKQENGFVIKGNQTFTSPRTIDIEGDYTSASAFLALKSLGDDLCIKGLDENSFQQDKRIASLIKNTIEKKGVVQVKSRVELLPVLVAVAGLTTGKCEFSLAPLKDNALAKINDCVQMLSKFGITSLPTSEGLVVFGNEKIDGGVMVDCKKDSSLIYGAIILALKGKEPSTLLSVGVINKTNPSFFNDIIKLGGGVQSI